MVNRKLIVALIISIIAFFAFRADATELTNTDAKSATEHASTQPCYNKADTNTIVDPVDGYTTWYEVRKVDHNLIVLAVGGKEPVWCKTE